MARFEARELKSYVDSISGDDLTKGSVYFLVNFTDAEMFIPTMNPVVYIGEDLEPGDEHQVYFQDVDSFNSGFRYGDDSAVEFARFERMSKNALGHVFEFEQALNELLSCSLRRQGKR